MRRLDRKVAIVTGGGQGIGLAIAAGFARQGARVVIADMLSKKAEEACEHLNSKFGTSDAPIARPFEVDVSDERRVARMVSETVEAFGSVDILVNNAALWKALARRPFYEILVDEWDRVFAVNTRGPFLCCKAVTPHMQKKGGGKIIFIGSATVWTAQSTLTHYAASKAALIGLVRCVARELGPSNICVNMLHPGMTDTGDTSREYLESRAKNRLIQRVQMPEDLVGAAVFLASADSDFMTGQQIHVDGGTVLS